MTKRTQTQKDINRQLWWDDVMEALGGEVELTYRPEYQDVPNGLFDIPHGTVVCMPVWNRGSITVYTWTAENHRNSHQVEVCSSDSPRQAAEIIRGAWS